MFESFWEALETILILAGIIYILVDLLVDIKGIVIKYKIK